MNVPDLVETYSGFFHNTPADSINSFNGLGEELNNGELSDNSEIQALITFVKSLKNDIANPESVAFVNFSELQSKADAKVAITSNNDSRHRAWRCVDIVPVKAS